MFCWIFAQNTPDMAFLGRLNANNGYFGPIHDKNAENIIIFEIELYHIANFTNNYLQVEMIVNLQNLKQKNFWTLVT